MIQSEQFAHILADKGDSDLTQTRTIVWVYIFGIITYIVITSFTNSLWYVHDFFFTCLYHNKDNIINNCITLVSKHSH